MTADMADSEFARMLHLNNPAGRLAMLLTEAKKIDGNIRAHKAWAILLDVSGDDRPALLSKLGHVLELPAIIQARIYRLDGINHTVYLEWVPTVENFFSNLNLEQRWVEFINRIDEKALYALTVCDEVLARKEPEFAIEKDEVEHLQTEVRDLFDRIREAEIDEEVKTYMLRHLELVDRALQEWRIRGVEPLRQAFEGVLGSLIVRKEMYHKANATDFGQQFWRFLGRVAVVMTLVVGTIQIGKDIRLCLPGPEELVEVAGASPSDDEDQEAKPRSRLDPA